MPDHTSRLRSHGNLPAASAQALGLLPNATPRMDIDATADVGGGGTTAVTGFQLKDQNGQNIAAARKVSFGVYDDVDGETPGANATLDTATAGSILSGAGTAEITVLTDVNGKFTCTLTDASDETVNLMGGQPIVGALPLDCSDRETVVFSA